MASNRPNTPAINESLEAAGGVNIVPDPWKGLFNNEEWLVHRIVVLSFYAFLAIAVVAHVLVFIWRPWIGF
ncbi:MAG: light-harvesting protein [Herpetosiphonaceae bacterium]|nr:light-harvesting protein [Herpetosiphonaceae bacterium]